MVLVVLLGAAAHCCTCAMRNKDRPVVSQSITVCVLGVKKYYGEFFGDSTLHHSL